MSPRNHHHPFLGFEIFLKCLCQVNLVDRFRPRYIRDRCSRFQHPVKSSCYQLNLSHGSFHQRLAGFIQCTVLLHLCWELIGIASNIGHLTPLALAFSCHLHRNRTSADDSPDRISRSFEYSTLGTCMCMSMRSIKSPKMCFCCFVIAR